MGKGGRDARGEGLSVGDGFRGQGDRVAGGRGGGRFGVRQGSKGK